jgi:anti-sigma regulatory factor (Ser/Thr protein kinase)
VVNVIVHGRPPMLLRIWAQPDRMTVTVADTGSGPVDPFIGLVLPTSSSGGGLGLWISHQLVDITHRCHGYAIRMTAGRPASQFVEARRRARR